MLLRSSESLSVLLTHPVNDVLPPLTRRRNGERAAYQIGCFILIYPCRFVADTNAFSCLGNRTALLIAWSSCIKGTANDLFFINKKKIALSSRDVFWHDRPRAKFVLRLYLTLFRLLNFDRKFEVGAKQWHKSYCK